MKATPAVMKVSQSARALKPVIAALILVYFLIDMVFIWLVTPLERRLGDLSVFRRFTTWLGSLGPYPSLLLFIVPLILLEPIKPVALYLTSTGHFFSGVLLVVVGELLKVLLLERMFQINRDKLMSFRAFAWVYDLVMRTLNDLRSIPAWQSAVNWLKTIKAAARHKSVKTGGGVTDSSSVPPP
jgi:hypothetical protein